MRRCCRCGVLKDRAAFHRSTRRYADGLDYCCRRCRNAGSLNYQRRVRIRRKQCVECQDGQHGPLCRGPAAGCGCKCRAMLGLEGPLEFGDPTAPSALDWGVA